MRKQEGKEESRDRCNNSGIGKDHEKYARQGLAQAGDNIGKAKKWKVAGGAVYSKGKNIVRSYDGMIPPLHRGRKELTYFTSLPFNILARKWVSPPAGYAVSSFVTPVIFEPLVA